jgi:hypothetical protein
MRELQGYTYLDGQNPGIGQTLVHRHYYSRLILSLWWTIHYSSKAIYPHALMCVCWFDIRREVALVGMQVLFLQAHEAFSNRDVCVLVGSPE